MVTVRRGYHALRRSTETNTEQLARQIAMRWQSQGYTTTVRKIRGGYRVTGLQEGAKKR